MVLGMELGTSHTLGKCSATKLHPVLKWINIYLSIYYAYSALSTCMHDRIGHQISLQIVVSHHVVTRN